MVFSQFFTLFCSWFILRFWKTSRKIFIFFLKNKNFMGDTVATLECFHGAAYCETIANRGDWTWNIWLKVQNFVFISSQIHFQWVFLKGNFTKEPLEPFSKFFVEYFLKYKLSRFPDFVRLLLYWLVRYAAFLFISAAVFRTVYIFITKKQYLEEIWWCACLVKYRIWP